MFILQSVGGELFLTEQYAMDMLLLHCSVSTKGIILEEKKKPTFLPNTCAVAITISP